MKKCSITYLLVIALLLFATFFSMSLTPVHMDDCQHTVCEHCQEIVAVENEVNAMLEGHGECRETACETCVFIEKQIEQLEELKVTEHSCHEAICDTCARIILRMRLQLFACALVAIFALVCATKPTTSLIIKEKTPRDRAFTLFALKVRLND